MDLMGGRGDGCRCSAQRCRAVLSRWPTVARANSASPPPEEEYPLWGILGSEISILLMALSSSSSQLRGCQSFSNGPTLILQIQDFPTDMQHEEKIVDLKSIHYLHVFFYIFKTFANSLKCPLCTVYTSCKRSQKVNPQGAWLSFILYKYLYGEYYEKKSIGRYSLRMSYLKTREQKL